MWEVRNADDISIDFPEGPQLLRLTIVASYSASDRPSSTELAPELRDSALTRRQADALEWMVERVGVHAICRALDEPATAVSRWLRRGVFSISEARAIALLPGMAELLRDAASAWEISVAIDWCASPNPELGGASPLSVLSSRGRLDDLATALQVAQTSAFA